MWSDASVQDIAYDPQHEQQLSLRVAAQVTDAWVTQDPGIVAHLDAFHPYAEGFAASRLSLKGKQQISVLALRCYTLPSPVQLANEDRLWGCFSWVDLNHSQTELQSEAPAANFKFPVQELIPALSDDNFQEQRQQLLKHVADLKPLELP